MTKSNTPKRTRAGTAQRTDGKATAVKIVEAAYQLLKTDGADDFSLRNVAQKAEVRLANLQYYYPRKEALIRALMEYVGDEYDRRYERHLLSVEDSPLGRFKAVIEFNLADVSAPETRHFFIQFWPLLGVADNYTGELLAQFYTPQKRQLCSRIKELNPALTPQEITLRSELITAMFEGLMVTSSLEHSDLEAMKTLILDQALALVS
ncbi:TetR/AcrR family transcriptional regulator [Pseudomaricurvus alkylphenolicus]|jgi:AcrR family transcriptional regulator|uniref:TetR/AcrR family transcriptional regulator n=1 Tax=Pseudomaricurvus alkylphenolicus TaxID=1306991 RepID=UPI00141ECFB9|nr:TetR/AcrR family transcriptional regulator [Pseudomaricurvus alkylphenolicus]NIB40421.1 TetR/AcrR family transcriptional regulator [Pseudomaricurvus alkylphenolicus]